MKVRLVQPSDVDRIESFYTSIVNIDYSRRTFETLTNSRYLSLVLENCDTGSIIGLSCSYRVWTSYFSTTREATLSVFGIAKSYQRSRLGTFLLNLTLTILDRFYSCKSVVAHIQKSNDAAFHFFEKHGLFAQRVIPAFYPLKGKGDEREDSILLIGEFDKWMDEFGVNEGIEIDQEIREMIAGKQKLGWFAQWNELP
jgi:ribosomal protein S18 acetylase RimI-like enzyme